MEKFEIDGEKNVELFSGFVGRAKSALTTLIGNIKTNIKEYETKIEDTAKEITDNELSREKCEHEITKMESRIDTIKDAIENVESTYRKIVDAYSSTSKGETKELYSEIIDGAKANCDKDVEKNRSEIARLNSDIEAIKNNITEFSKIIDELNKDLDNYNNELYRYTKALEYMDKVEEKTLADLEEISSKKEPKMPKKTTEAKRVSRVREETPEDTSESDEGGIQKKPIVKEEVPTSSLLDSIREEYNQKNKVEELIVTEPKKPEVKREPVASSIDDSLKHLYDMTGYKPNKPIEPEVKEIKEEPKPFRVPEPVPVIREEEKQLFTDNLESLFATSTPDVEVTSTPEVAPFMESDIASWESILNAPGEDTLSETKELNMSIKDGIEDTVNQLLNPYGTTYSKLKGLVKDAIVYKDGSKVPFDMTTEDVIKAVNAVDGTDLKKMKTVGPEITLLRKIKDMKEGNL